MEDNYVIGQIIGIVQKHIDKENELYVDNLAVSEGHQRKRIATRLYKKILHISKEYNCTSVWIAVDPENSNGIDFYKSLNLTQNEARIFSGQY